MHNTSWKDRFLKLLSFIYPIAVLRKQGVVSSSLEVRWENGRKVLNSRLANYSYGSLHTFWKRSFKIHDPSSARSALILGGGAGSIQRILHEDLALDLALTLVESDPEVVELAIGHFGLQESDRVKIEVTDAFSFCQEHAGTFDLILVDLFVDLDLPGELLQPSFWKDLDTILAQKGTIMLNTIIHNEKSKEMVDGLHELISNRFRSVEHHHVQELNQLFIIDNS